MKDGYYLSLYIYINKIAHLTGCENRHDQSVALFKKEDKTIKLLRYWELERISGLKQHKLAFYDVEQAKYLLNTLLSEFDLKLDQMVEIWGTPELDTSTNYHSLVDYSEFCYHNICHLFSSLLSDTSCFYNNDIISLAVDLGPDNVVDTDIYDKYFYSGCYSHKGEIKEIVPIYSPAFYWGYSRMHFGLKEGTLMALASASTSELYNYQWENVFIKKNEDFGNVVAEMNKLFDYVSKLTINEQGKLFNYFDNRFTELENRISMVMKEVQKISLFIMEKNIDEIVEKYNIDPSKTYLSMSGGYALNCPTNSKLMNKYNFLGFVAPPCVNDSGMALGVGLYAFYKNLEPRHFEFKLENAFYGQSDNDIENVINKYKYFIFKISDIDFNQVTEDIEKYPIAWFNGNAEIGPRALGNRSLLADPRKNETKDILNNIKQREWWRPVAPLVLESKINDWFYNSYPSRYMLHTFNIKEDKKALVPAIAHLDSSARVQSIDEESNKSVYKIIEAFYIKTGIPVICNTSLNDRGEPIINTIEELFNFVLRKEMPVAYVNGKRIEFINHHDFAEKDVAQRKMDFVNYIDKNQKERLLDELNPYKCSLDELVLYTMDVRIQREMNIREEKGAKQLNHLYKMRKNVIKF